MKIFSGISSFLSRHSKNIIPKAAGLAALAYVTYDAHYVGKMEADLYSSERDADNCKYYLNSSMYSTNMSKIQDGIKDAAYTMELDCGWKRFINSGIGYIKGFASMWVTHVVPVVLGIGALVSGKKIGKVCTGGLGVYAAYELVKNFFGLGVPKGQKF